MEINDGICNDFSSWRRKFLQWMDERQKTALVACNDGFRPVNFLLEATDEEADVFE